MRPCHRPEYRELADRTARTPELLPLIAVCPHRGPVLPVSRQPECGCRELSECRAGKGRTPGEVTTEDCLTCVARRDRLNVATLVDRVLMDYAERTKFEPPPER